MDKQIRYLPDESGTNRSNKVENEPHKLKKQIANRIVVPLYGCFFSESVVVRDNFKKRILRYKKDYVFGGLRSNYTILTGKEVSSFIIIINDDVSDSVTIDYQAYGGLPVCNIETIIELLETSLSNDTNIPFVKLLDLPKSYKPTFHYHDLGDIDKMEFLLFCLEKIRFSVMYSHQELFKFLYGFDRLLQTLIDKALVEFEAELYRKMKQYIDAFKKSLFGLDLIENYGLMTSQDGSDIANGDHPSVIRDNEELYFSLKALSAFSSSIYELFTNIEETGLGAPHEFTVAPSSARFEELPVGSGFVISPLGYFAGDTSVEKFYPDRLEKDNSYFVKKLTSRQTSLTPLFLYVGKNTTKAYVMTLLRTAEEYVTKFTKIAATSDGNVVFDTLQAHIENYDNPHMDDKRDVDLAQVENLPLATMEDVICNIPARRYMTLKTLFSYMKRFKTGKKEVSEIYENYSLQNQTRRLQTIFSPCGTWKNDIDESKIELCKVLTTRAPIQWIVNPDVIEITIVLEPVLWTISQDKTLIVLGKESTPYFTIYVNKTLSTSFNDPIVFTVTGHDLVSNKNTYLVIEAVGGELDGGFIPPHLLGTEYSQTFSPSSNELEFQTLLDGDYANDFKFIVVLRDSHTNAHLANSKVVNVSVPRVTTSTTTTTTTTTQAPINTNIHYAGLVDFSPNLDPDPLSRFASCGTVTDFNAFSYMQPKCDRTGTKNSNAELELVYRVMDLNGPSGNVLDPLTADDFIFEYLEANHPDSTSWSQATGVEAYFSSFSTTQGIILKIKVIPFSGYDNTLSITRIKKVKVTCKNSSYVNLNREFRITCRKFDFISNGTWSDDICISFSRTNGDYHYRLSSVFDINV